MNAGRVIIIDNSKEKLGAGLEFFSRLFIALILAAAEQGRKNNIPVYIYIDECQNVIRNDEKIATILNECRSAKIALLMAHQSLAQIDDNKVQAGLADCDLRFANTNNDAKALADGFRTTPEVLQNLDRGQFQLYVEATKRSTTINVPNANIETWDKMSDPEFQALRREMAKRFSYTPKPPRPFNPETAPDPNDVPTGSKKY